jgi:hypothetical protein
VSGLGGWAAVDETMTEINVRIATPDDTAGVLTVLTEVAAEIPLRLDTHQQQEAVRGIITKGISFGESLVALDNNGSVVGFLLIEPDELERFQHDNQALNLRYGGVAKSRRRAGIFRALLQQAMVRRVLLTATVKAANQSGMAERLVFSGFQKLSAESPNQDNFRWEIQSR